MNEWALIDRLTDRLPRTVLQRNRPHASDAEIVELPGGGLLLAATTDSITEEIEHGLYTDPWMIGWMAVTVSVSDLAAVGARPLGMLLNLTLPVDADDGLVEALGGGLSAATRASKVPVLGGDTETGRRLGVSTTALGLVSGGSPLSRVGTRPGDLLYASGPLGLGAAYALDRLRRCGGRNVIFRPKARIAEGLLLPGLATACIDTSDGGLDALERLSTLNRVGFVIDTDRPGLWHPVADRVILEAGLPRWLLLAGLHGEYELLFTVSPGREAALLAAARTTGWRPVRAGVATADLPIRISGRDGEVALDPVRSRSVFERFDGDLARLLDEVMEVARP